MSKIKLLLAEDELSLGMIIKESLETRDFQVTLCKDGDEAVAEHGPGWGTQSVARMGSGYNRQKKEGYNDD